MLPEVRVFPVEIFCLFKKKKNRVKFHFNEVQRLNGTQTQIYLMEWLLNEYSLLFLLTPTPFGGVVAHTELL